MVSELSDQTIPSLSSFFQLELTIYGKKFPPRALGAISFLLLNIYSIKIFFSSRDVKTKSQKLFLFVKMVENIVVNSNTTKTN